MLHVASVCTPCCMLLHVIAVSLGVVAQSLKPVRLLHWAKSRVQRNNVGSVCTALPTLLGPRTFILAIWSGPRHVDYIIKKVNKGLYSLRVLKQCGAPPVSLAKVFVAIVRPILKYAVSVWQNIPEFLASTIENIQKRATRFIFPMHDYNEALYALSLHLCQVYIARLQNENHPLHCSILPKLEEVHNNYHLRSGAPNL